MEIVSFEIAKKLKEKGFRERTLSMYLESVKLPHTPLIYSLKDWNKDDNCYSAPTISQVLKWLREEKKIFIHIDVYINDKFDYFFSIAEQGRETWDMAYIGEEDYKTYELAAIAGVKYVIDNLI